MVVFQILSWSDFEDEDDNGENRYNIRLFGRTKKQETVYLQIENFCPYFYIEIDEKWKVDKNFIMNYIHSKISPDIQTGLLESNLVMKHRFYGFTNNKKFKFIELVFRDMRTMNIYISILNRKHWIKQIDTRNPIKFKLYESNIRPPYLRFMHKSGISSVGWISIDDKKLEEFDEEPTTSQYNYKTDWRNVEPVDDVMIEKFIIASFDIECVSVDGSFPQPERDTDKVIQIGITLSRYGESDCYYKHLLALHETAEIEGATVESFDTEEELLLGFTKFINKFDPDIITGYNIFGFDFEYLKKRCHKFGMNIQTRFARFSRVNNEESEWKNITLASSALGNNELKYYDMTGRVMLDLMKVVQRDYRLSSYKLDSVASFFIREVITNFEQITEDKLKISTKNTFGLINGQYIILAFQDGNGGIETYYNDEEKFKIIELGKDYIIVKGKLDITHDVFELKGKRYWCQAKDDIKPYEIFSMFDKTPEDRAIIGKYCLQDCALVNKLIAKLQIITNNMSMALVCNVPFSYLFLRGQGIKIFSLVSKKCRLKEHLIPVIKKPKIIDNKQNNPEDMLKKYSDIRRAEKIAESINRKGIDDEDVQDDDGYEGAIVFHPEPNVYFSPIPVLDYASLYPNSMILRNLSHECLVNDSRYDNLDGYKYHEITFKNDNGTYTKCRFAEKEDGTKGIIPEILMDLLSARKKYKKLMNSETDPFKKSILNSLQLAYKVTANSLYGQTGASTSAIFMKEIAASTTATGREMLLFSKYFIEDKYTQMIKHAQTDKNNYVKYMLKVFKYYPTNMTVKAKEIEASTIGTKNERVIEAEHNIHVNTLEKELIHDEKFNKPYIGYEYDIKFDENSKELFKDINQYKFSKLVNYNIEKRNKFLKMLKKCLFKNDNNKKLYSRYKKIWDEFDIDSIDTLCDKLNKIENKKLFFENMKLIVDDIGYTNKNDMIDKFYEFVEDTINNYIINNKVIYGDSITGHTPLLLRDKDNKIIIKTIESLGHEWITYYDDKLQDINIKYEIWTEQGWSKIKRVIKHETNKQIYGINTHTGYVEVTEDHSLLNPEGEVIKPSECVIGSKLLNSLPYIANNTNYNDKTIYIECDNQHKAMEYYLLMKSKYNNVIVDVEDNKFILNPNNDLILEPNTIKKIIKLPQQTRWVYDLETENHHFQAGVGDIIVHNTDSVFFCSNITDKDTNEIIKNKTALEMSIKIGIWASLLIGSLLPTPMSQEYEKVLYPFIIQGKKRYVGNLYEKDPNHFVQKSMGIELKRRDNAPVVKIMSAGIINQLLNFHSAVGACDFTKNTLKQIITGKYSMSNFVITKTLKGNSLTKAERKEEEKKPKEQRYYANRSSIVHAVLADRIADRDPGNKPLSNDRIAYAYVVKKLKKNALQGDRVETPEYIKEHNLKIDYLFYITNQIMKPALKFLNLVCDNAPDIFKEYIIKEENHKKNIKPFGYYLDKYKEEEDNDENRNNLFDFF